MKKKVQQRRKEKLFIAILSSILFIILGIIILNYIETDKTSKLSECFSLNTEAEKATCIKEQAVISLNGDLCGHISDSAAAQHCIEVVQVLEHLVKSGQYEAVFEKLSIKPLPLSELYEYDMVFAEFAAATGNLIFCQEPSSQQARDRCYKRYAYAHKDTEACTAVIDVSDRDSCFIQLAMAGIDIECGMIEDGNLKESCFSFEMNNHSKPTTKIII